MLRAIRDIGHAAEVVSKLLLNVGAAAVVTFKLDDLANGLIFVQRESIWVGAAALMAKKADVFAKKQEKALHWNLNVWDMFYVSNLTFLHFFSCTCDSPDLLLYSSETTLYIFQAFTQNFCWSW